MLSITCAQCRRLFTLTDEEIQRYLDAGLGKRHTLVTCPHCGRGNKTAPERLRQAVRFRAPAGTPEPSEPPSDVSE